MKKQMVRDEHGYINERGASKYWGVTTSKVGSERIWVVNFKVGGVTWGYRAKNFILKEVDAARIGAFLYEAGEKTVNSRDHVVRILSADKKYVMTLDLDDTYIYREKATNQKVYQFQPNLTLPLESAAESLPTVTSLGPVETFSKQAAAPVKDKKAPDYGVDVITYQGDNIVSSLIVPKEVDKKPSERELVSLITDAIMADQMSKTTARILIGILEQAV